MAVNDSSRLRFVLQFPSGLFFSLLTGEVSATPTLRYAARFPTFETALRAAIHYSLDAEILVLRESVETASEWIRQTVEAGGGRFRALQGPVVSTAETMVIFDAPACGYTLALPLSRLSACAVAAAIAEQEAVQKMDKQFRPARWVCGSCGRSFEWPVVRDGRGNPRCALCGVERLQ